MHLFFLQFRLLLLGSYPRSYESGLHHSILFTPSFYTIFRNSGFALSTLIIRIALATLPFYNVLLGLAATLFAILLTMISNHFF